MTTTTAEYWSVITPAGVEYPLNTLAKNIETWGEDRQAPIPLRGEDSVIPWMPGEKEQVRVPDARTMSMGMWVIGCDDDGNVPIDRTAREQFVRNWLLLRRIFHSQGLIYTLRKRFYDESYTLRTADARVRYEGGLSPAMMGRTGAKFTIDLRLADPYFYSTVGVSLSLNSTVDAAANGLLGSMSAVIPGDANPRKMVFNGFAGASGATGITIECTSTGHVWSISGSAAAGDILLFDMGNQLARIADVNRTGNVSHTGSNDWMRLMVGPDPCILRLTCSTGDCYGNLTYKSVWN